MSESERKRCLIHAQDLAKILQNEALYAHVKEAILAERWKELEEILLENKIDKSLVSSLKEIPHIKELRW